MLTKKHTLGMMIVVAAIALLALMWLGLAQQQTPIASQTQLNSQTKPANKIAKPSSIGKFSHAGLDATLASQNYSEADLPQDLYLLNIWGSWCRSCVAEHKFLRDYSTKLPIVGLSWYDSASKARAFLEKYGNPFHMVILDTEGSTIIDLGITGAPETLLLRGHKILLRHTGILTPAVFASKFLPLIEPQ